MTIIARAAAAAFATASLAVLAAPAAQAAEAKPQPQKFSKPVQPVLLEVQKLLAAKTYTEVPAKLDAIEPLASTPDDKYYIGVFRIQVGQSTNDRALLEKGLTGALDSGKTPPDQQKQFIRTLASLAAERKDYPAAIPRFEQLAAMDPNDTEILYGLATLYNAVGDKAKMQDYLGKAFAANDAKGVKSPENWYKLRLGIAVEAKNNAAIPDAGLALVTAYPSPVNWRDTIFTTRDSFPTMDDQGQLDYMRLQAAANALNGERDFVEYADTALQRGYPGEAQYAINTGIQKGMLQSSKPLVAELKKSADGKVVADKAGLPAAEKEAKGNPKLLVATGDAFYGYGDFAKAAVLYKQAQGGAGVDANTVNLRLGAALARAGDAAGAEAALAQVTSGPRAPLARLWLAWLKAPKA